MRRRILQIIPDLDHHGAARQLGLLACGLPRAEFDVHVCALRRGGPWASRLIASGVPVMTIGARWPCGPLAFWRLRRYVAQLGPELIHTWTGWANRWGYAVARSCGIDCLVISHRSAQSGAGMAAQALDRYIARRCCQVVVNSVAVREFCLRCGLPEGRIRVIANGVAPAERPRATRAQLLAELGLPTGSRLIGLTGPLRRQKRIKDAIWAADLLKVIRKDVHLLILGHGPHQDRLRKFRDQVVIRDKVHFLGDREDVLRLMPHFDVFWSTSACEGQANGILEAMAVGVPVVATDIPGNRDLVLHAATGYLVPVGDRAAVARWTNNLLDDAPLARRLGEAGRQRAADRFNLQTMIDGYAALYRELLTP